MTDHDTCPGVLKGKMRQLGIDITVSTVAPIVKGPYTTDAFICPHGTKFWIEPTGEQIAEWVEAGVL